jgi:error-prone DNA polymerase
MNELLEDTLGVILYQDQVLTVATEIGGLTPGQADQFRRAMSRRRSAEEMEKFRQAFVVGAGEKHEIPPNEAEAIFDKLRGFSEFGFPKSHAYAFAILAYQSTWLRRYYPAEFYAALLNNQPMGFYAPNVLIGDAKRHGLQVLRVSVNRSGVRTTPGKGQIRLGISSVRGVGEEVAKALVAEREARGSFTSLRDLLARTALARAPVESLIAVGALADLGLGRRELLWQLGLLSHQAPTVRLGPSAFARAGSSGQFGRNAAQTSGPGRGRRSPPLARQPGLPLPIEQDMVHLPDMTEWERMIADYGLLDLSPSYHPLGLLRPRLPVDLLMATALRGRNGQRVRTAGLVVCRQRPGTAKGYVFLLVEDETGLTNVVVKPDLYERERSIVRGAPYLCIKGLIREQSGSLNLVAEEVTPLMELSGVVLPHPPLRHPYPGAPFDPREQPLAPDADLPLASDVVAIAEELLRATPAAHNFH